MFFSATCIIFFHTFIFQPRMFIREVVNWHLSPGSETREKIILGAVLMRRARRRVLVLHEGLVADLTGSFFSYLFMRRPMLTLAIGIAICSLRVLRLMPPSSPHSAHQHQQACVMVILLPVVLWGEGGG